MNENEIKVLRMNLLGGMNQYILNIINDEEIIENWQIYGIPDEVSEEELAEIAEDEELFLENVHLFSNLTAKDFNNC